MDALLAVAIIAGAYLTGAVPWGIVLGRLKGIDPREHGSGGTGATNTLRLLGWRIAVLVFLLDFLKGTLPVVAVRLLDGPTWLSGTVAVATVVGHCWSVFIGFKGGKGMATGGGAATGLAPFLFVLIVMIALVIWLTRYVSLASLLTALAGPSIVTAMAIWGDYPWWWVLAMWIMAAIIVVQHRTNIQRLLNGTERKFGNREATNPTPAA
ncbi:MAG TPA: glycerol-3-phosphate 1-O-acyltransferase PlsY [Thermomicrobiales bacterium]|nr:glycerol-3-phosphate 1-O-acyltransferase PlsY [Thermomicrobiales bacterium]